MTLLFHCYSSSGRDTPRRRSSDLFGPRARPRPSGRRTSACCSRSADSRAAATEPARCGRRSVQSRHSRRAGLRDRFVSVGKVTPTATKTARPAGVSSTDRPSLVVTYWRRSRASRSSTPRRVHGHRGGKDRPSPCLLGLDGLLDPHPAKVGGFELATRHSLLARYWYVHGFILTNRLSVGQSVELCMSQ
jgi:hypothetical protein